MKNEEDSLVGYWTLANGMRARVTKKSGMYWVGKIPEQPDPVFHSWDNNGCSIHGPQYDLKEKFRSAEVAEGKIRIE